MAKYAFPSGEKNHAALLHEEDVRAIFEWSTVLGMEGSWIAEHFGISEYAVSSIVTGKTWRHLNLPIRSIDQRRIDKFWRQVDKGGEDDCWNWLGKHYRDTGYGKFHWNGRLSTAHKFSYELHKGLVSKGNLVAHSCDNRRCVNPNHLSEKTYKQNVEEMWERGRQSPPPDTARKPGEGNPSHKLKTKEVEEIRRRRKAGEKGRDLAKIYKVSPSTICQVFKGNRWRHTYAS